MTDPNKNYTKEDVFREGEGERPIPAFYDVYDTDLARDNLENDIPAADLEEV